MTLGVDGGPGIVISQWTSNSSDFLRSPPLNTKAARLYPAQLSRKDGDTTYRAYRAQLMPQRQPESPNLWPETADNWYQVDEIIYNNLATDAFVIGLIRTELFKLSSVMHCG